MPTIPSRNRKLCAICQADVTFAHRLKQPDGTFLCQMCVSLIPSKEIGGGSAPVPISNGSPLKSVNSPETPHATDGIPNTKAAAQPKPVIGPIAEESTSRGFRLTPGLWGFLGLSVALLIVGLSTWLILRPDWERANMARMEAMYNEGQRLLVAGKPKESYAKFSELFAFVGDHSIADHLLQGRLEDGKRAMQEAYAAAKPLIEQEEREHQQRIAEQERAEEDRVSREREAKAREEQARRESARKKQAEEQRARADVLRKQRESIVRATFLKSAEYRQLLKEADDVANQLRANVVVEQSAYQAMSSSARAVRDLTAIFVKIQGRLTGTNVTVKVNRALSDSNTTLIGEDSAIRAIYAKDRGTFELLGIWCQSLGKDGAGAFQEFEKLKAQADRETIIDDSAPRAITRYSGVSLQILNQLASIRNAGPAANEIIHRNEAANALDDSTWRVSMRNAEGTFEILLLLLARDDDPQVQSLRSRVKAVELTDDSALRVQSEFRQGAVEVLQLMIRNP